MAGLSYATATRIAMRELKASRGKFAFVLLSVAIGVAALTGVRGFSSSFRSTLLLRARAIMAADIAAKTFQPPTPEERAKLTALEANGVQETEVTELVSMASAAGSLDPLLVALKAVDPTRYPFYGDVTLDPAMPLTQALTDSTVAVGDDLLLRLHLKVGDSIKLGTRTYRIAATVLEEPDRLSGAFAAGPRVLLSQHALADSGLIAPGSHANRRYLYKLPPPPPGRALSDEAVAALKTQLEATLPEAQLTDYREANPSITRALDGATGLLSLMSLVALVLGAVGVAMAMRAHLQQRLDSIAIMKSLGADSSQVIKIYTIQTLLLGLGGGLLGVVFGLGVQMAFPLFLAKLLHLTPAFRLDAGASALGLGSGLLTTLLFTLPPLLDIRDVRPILILRRAVEVSEDPFVTRLWRKLLNSGAEILAVVLILGGLVLLAWRVSDSARVGAAFAGAIAVILLVLLGACSLLLWLLKKFLARTRLALPSVLRHGLANLYRPGNPSAALLAALGLGVMQIAAVYMVQRSIVNDMQAAIAENLPNIFLVDMTSDEAAGIRTLLATQPQVKGNPELVPVFGSRILAVDGVAAAELQKQREQERAKQGNGQQRGPGGGGAFRSINLTWAPTDNAPPPGETVVAGKWWTTAQAADAAKHPIVAMERQRADRLHIKVGSQLTITEQDTQVNAQVVALFDTDSRHAFSRAEFVVPSKMLAGMPVVWYGGIHCDPAATSQLRRVLYEHYPTVTVIDVAATLEVVRQVILQITYVIQFLAAFSIFAGIVILASAIAGTRYRRIREVVVLKTLGATRPRIATIFSIEFAVLGLVAGFVGVVFANLLARTLLLHALHFGYQFQPWLSLGEWLLVGARASACSDRSLWRS
ncbi:putative ABC transport system permease protein [Bryocella elongata]|uniref:Putative ABC transport system permease protein n=1 Tax=Bryocella elongata TaxID=863522 RepID=A0A1H5U916_9BACT|nr:FtsX-like permease family protein [Bryocella elongata]SEF71615.1 putative ABC transport system permease protein [Bryocella elongata]